MEKNEEMRELATMRYSQLKKVKNALLVFAGVFFIGFLWDGGHAADATATSGFSLRFVVYVVIFWFVVTRIVLCNHMKFKMKIIRDNLHVYYPWMKKYLYKDEKDYKKDVLLFLPFVFEFKWLKKHFSASKDEEEDFDL